MLASLQLAAVRVPAVLGGDDEGHGRREGPTREGEVLRGEGGGTIILSCGSRGSHAYEQSYWWALIDQLSHCGPHVTTVGTSPTLLTYHSTAVHVAVGRLAVIYLTFLAGLLISEAAFRLEHRCLVICAGRRVETENMLGLVPPLWVLLKPSLDLLPRPSRARLIN